MMDAESRKQLRDDRDYQALLKALRDQSLEQIELFYSGYELEEQNEESAD
jgi:hypothetical protein